MSFDGVEVDVIIDKAKTDNSDVIMLFHGTVGTDSKILDASQLILDNTKMMLNDREVTFVSVVYPEENLLFGDNIKFGEVAVRWVKEKILHAKRIRNDHEQVIHVGAFSRWTYGH